MIDVVFDTITESFPQLNLQHWPYYLLILVRASGIFVLSPIFGRRNLPVQYRLGLALIITIIFSRIYPPAEAFGSEPALGYVLMVIGELAVGLVLAFVTVIFFTIPAIAGQIIDIQMGIGMGSVFDPSIGAQTTYSAMLLNIFMTVYFFMVDGHLKLIRIVDLSFKRIPAGQVELNQSLTWMATEAFLTMFSLAVTLAMPIIGSALISEVTMGILMRAVPNFHAYMVGIPLKIIIGLVVLFAMQPFYLHFMDDIFSQMLLTTEQMLTGLGG